MRPVALLVSGIAATEADALVGRCPHLSPDLVFRGAEFRRPEAVEVLRSLDLDVILSVHFPYLVPKEVLDLPRLGCLNLHPAYLPWNRGWHTATWALLEGTPIGATLHVMDEGVDSGDIVHQRQLEVRPFDVAHDLYSRLFELELEVLREAWPWIASGSFPRTPQYPNEGTRHDKNDLFASGLQRLELGASSSVGDVLRRLRAFTTNRLDEAAYFEDGDRRYHVQVRIVEAGEEA